jgi:hypothetical protein
MTERGYGIAHALVCFANVVMVPVCSFFAALSLHRGMISLCFLNCALITANAYMAYFNFSEAKKRLL